MTSSHGSWAAIAAALVLALLAPQAHAQVSPEARQIALEGYIYGYPLVTMEYTRRVMTNVAEPVGTRAPMGHLIKMREYPTAAFRDVTAPNADTLYTTAWLDVGAEPWIISLPDAADRYYLFPMLSGWTDVFEVPGKRTTGTGPQTYAITGPGFTGALPAGVTQYKSPTNLVWILGRIYCTGTPEDYAAVHKLQDEITLVPLSAYDDKAALKDYSPPAGTVDASIDMKTPVREQVNALSVDAYFQLLAMLMKDNPPAEADAPIIAELAKIGVVPGEPVDLSKFGAPAEKALADVPAAGVKTITETFATAGKPINGWQFTTDTGLYGTKYLDRALITYFGLGANRPQDAVYPTSETDAAGQPYTGAKKYVVHFDKGQLPPVDGFWSLTMYNAEYYFVDNPLNRYNLSGRNKLVENADGSVDLYLQHENPGPGKEANWLPAPAEHFVLMLRLYWPKETAPSIIDGTWKPPAVTAVE